MQANKHLKYSVGKDKTEMLKLIFCPFNDHILFLVCVHVLKL